MMRPVATASGLGRRCSVLRSNAVSFFGRPVQIVSAGQRRSCRYACWRLEGLTTSSARGGNIDGAEDWSIV